MAGSDSGGGAGIQADLKAFAAVHVHGTAAITCVTAQNTVGVQRVDALPVEAIDAQLRSVAADLPPHAVKTGMLHSADVVRLVCEHVERLGVPVVVDPVMAATSGDALARTSMRRALPALFERAVLVTPNVDELAALTGRTIATPADAVEAARALCDKGPAAVLAKGGHLAGPDAVDVLVRRDTVERFAFPRVEGAFHGAGCHYASLIAGLLARGRDLPSAVDEARSRMHHAIRRAYRPGAGPAVLDVLDAAPTQAAATPEESAVGAAAWRFAALVPADLVPEVGTNIAFLPPGETDPASAAGLTRRITRGADGPTPPGAARVGASGHVARVAAAAAAADPSMRAALNLRCGEPVQAAIRLAGLTAASFERSDEPAGVSSVAWGTTAAIRRAGRVPDMVWDDGAPGKEAMVRVLGTTPADVVHKALRTADALAGPRRVVTRG